jgi:hypothetical protein
MGRRQAGGATRAASGAPGLTATGSTLHRVVAGVAISALAVFFVGYPAEVALSAPVPTAYLGPDPMESQGLVIRDFLLAPASPRPGDTLILSATVSPSGRPLATGVIVAPLVVADPTLMSTLKVLDGPLTVPTITQSTPYRWTARVVLHRPGRYTVGAIAAGADASARVSHPILVKNPDDAIAAALTRAPSFLPAYVRASAILFGLAAIAFFLLALLSHSVLWAAQRASSQPRLRGAGETRLHAEQERWLTVALCTFLGVGLFTLARGVLTLPRIAPPATHAAGTLAGLLEWQLGAATITALFTAAGLGALQRERRSFGAAFIGASIAVAFGSASLTVGDDPIQALTWALGGAVFGLSAAVLLPSPPLKDLVRRYCALQGNGWLRRVYRLIG